jgi:FAD/FMN-containing dehydrogenase
MKRRTLLKYLAAASVLAMPVSLGMSRASAEVARRRVRLGDAEWPDTQGWDRLRRSVEGNLIAIEPATETCRIAPGGAACQELFRELKNPYFIADSPSLTQTCGWVGGWTSQPSVYAVRAKNAAHVAAAVNFARQKNLRLVIKGGGHSYLGTSNAPDSLLIWTRSLDDIVMHDAFVPQGAAGKADPVSAVTVGAGAVWMHVYGAVTSDAGRYVQGGGCGTVGVAGLVQGGGFGTYSKRFGSASASLLEAEVVTADGAIRTVNAWQDSDLYWALKGGGGGSFGVVTRLTLRTWDLPASFGSVSIAIEAKSDDAYRRLLARFVSFYSTSLFNPHWGDLARAMPGRRLDIGMNFQGLQQAEAADVWRPFFAWIAEQNDLSATEPAVFAGPGRYRWDRAMLEKFVPSAIRRDDRPNAPAANFFWAANLPETGHVIHDFQSLWLPSELLAPERQAALVEALVAASGHWTIEMHFQKGLAGAPPDVIAATLDTPINPEATQAFMLAIVASEGPPGFKGLLGHEPDEAQARRDAMRITAAIAELRKVAPEAGCYVAESSYFLQNWQRDYWGPNYPRLLAVKARYDPEGLFFVRHGVGSEDWSEDGFDRPSARDRRAPDRPSP